MYYEEYFLKMGEAILQDVTTGKYYILPKEKLQKLNTVVSRYGARELVPNDEKIKVRAAKSISQLTSQDLKIHSISIRNLHLEGSL